MPNILSFRCDLVQPLYEHTLQCKEHTPDFEQMYDGRFRLDGKDFADEDGFPNISEVDLTKVPPGLWLVADQGVYLMSNGTPRDLVNTTQSRIAYADGFNPIEEDLDGWYERKRQMMGGDDQSLFIPADWIEQFIASTKPIRIWLESDGMSVTQFGIVPDI